MIGFSKEQILSAVFGAKADASQATARFLATHGDRDACGFAWVTIYDVRSNSRAGKALVEAGFSKSHTGGLQLWNPSGNHTQAITAKEAGAQAFADSFRAQFPEVKCYAGSRMD